MAVSPVSWIDHLDKVVGKGHATLPDVANRPMRQILVTSGMDVDGVGFTGLEPVFNVKSFAAVGNGVVDDTAAVQAAVNAASAVFSGIVHFPPLATAYKVGNVDCTGKRVIVRATGAQIACTSASGAFSKTDHNTKFTLDGGNFTGTGTACAVVLSMTPSGNTFDDYRIKNATFTMAANAYAVKIIGCREGYITHCTFNSPGNGVYYQQSVSPFLLDSLFIGQSYTGRGVFYDGTGSGFDAGLVMERCEVMGWDKGVEINGTQFFVMKSCTIDLNNWSIILAAQEVAMLCNNYIGSIGTNPALTIQDNLTVPHGVTYCAEINVSENAFNGTFTGGNTYDCISITGHAERVRVHHNDIAFYTRYGVNFNINGGQVALEDNTFAARATFGVHPIFNTGGANDGLVTIRRNYFANTATVAGFNISFAKVNDNFFCVTENSGQASSGTGVSFFTIAHSLAYTPAAQDVQIFPINAEAASKNAYFGGSDATNIQVNFTAATASAATVAWVARRH